MDFGKASAGQHRKKNETSSFFKEARIAYLNIQGSTLESLQRDLEAMEAQLESEKDLFVRAEIKGEIDETRDKIRNLSNIEVPLNALLLQGMKLNIDEIDDLLKQEKVISIRNKLAQKRENCVIALNKRVSEVTNLTELDKALDQMQIDETLENKLASGSIDQVTLDLILSSDMKHFMNEAFIGEVESARDKMTAEDNRILKHEEQAILEDIQDKTDKEWSKLKGETQMEIEKLTAEKQSLQSQVGKAKLSDRNRIRKRIREIDRLIERFQAEMEEGRLQFSRKHFTKNETSSARRVGHLADAGTLSKLRTLASEAKLLKLSKIKQYMDSEFDSLEAELESGEREAILGKEVMAKLRAEIRKGKEFLLSKNEVSPSDLKTIGLNLKEAEGLLSLTEKEIATLKKNRPAVEGEVMTAYGKLKAGIETVDPDQMRKVISLRQEELRKQGFKEDSKILSTVEASLTQLTDPSGELRVRLRKYDEALKDIGSLEPSELILLQEELKQMAPQIEMLSNLDEFIVKALSEENQAAQMAHSAIKDLDLVENNKELKEALLDNLGPDHLEFVPKSEFETKYRRYTESGHMVFYQKGDQWKIILDESALESESLEVLKKQLKHELLHLEFEKGQGVKEQVRRMLVEADPKRWEKVRAAFIAMAKEGKKSPPNGKEWKDDDILSELYAMQHEIGRVWSKGDTAVDELNNLLVGLDVKSNIGNMEEMIRGYEGGVKLEDDPEALTKAATETKELSKSQATYEKNKADIGKLSDRIKSLQGSDVVGYVDGAGPLLGKMSSFNDESAHLNEDLLKHPDNAVIVVSISARNTQLDKDLKTVEAEISRAAKDLPNQEMGVLGKVWIDTTFFSLADVVQLGKDVYEFFARRHERKKKDHAARLGKAFFNGTDLGREASARQEKAEAEEVQEWQSRYENKDAWELLDELKNLGNSLLPSKDQLKAILRILAQKGRIEWRDPNLWKVLNRLQSSVSLIPGDQRLSRDPILLRQRLHKALGEIWDYDEFTTLERQNESSYDGEKSKFNHRHDRMQDKLTDELDAQLALYRSGQRVDPVLYESLIDYCIENGKSYAENVMFHLLTAMAEGILSPDRGLALGKHLNKWPCVEWFPTLQPPYNADDFKKLCEDNFGASFKLGSIDKTGGFDFKNWFWTEVQNNKSVIERVQKSVGERDWDHDWGRTVACLGDADTAKRFLSGRSGQQETKSTAVGNAYTGAVQWLEENSLNPRMANKKNFARMAAWIAMSEGILSGMAYNRKENDINTRANESMNVAEPREASVGRHGGASLKAHRQITQQFLLMIEPEFFAFILEKEARTDQQKKEYGQQAAQLLIQKYPTLAEELEGIEAVDQIYDRMDLIIQTIFDHMSQEEFETMLNRLSPAS